MGTVHTLEALRGIDSARVAVMVTTDKVYRDHGRREIYGENDPLGGYDPYSASKAAAEIVIESYRKSYLAAQGVAVASARAGNVIGGGDWSEDRLIPDAVRAWQAEKTLEIRRPDAVRPWQHVLEPLSGYLTLAQKLWEGSAPIGAYNFGPDTGDETSVRDLIQMACRAYGPVKVRYGEGEEGPHEIEVARTRHRQGEDDARRFTEVDRCASGRSHDGVVSSLWGRGGCAAIVRGRYCRVHDRENAQSLS